MNNDIKSYFLAKVMQKFRALDMSYFLVNAMPKSTGNFGMTFAKNRTYRAPEICRNGNESTFRQNIGHSEFPCKLIFLKSKNQHFYAYAM